MNEDTYAREKMTQIRRDEMREKTRQTKETWGAETLSQRQDLLLKAKKTVSANADNTAVVMHREVAVPREDGQTVIDFMPVLLVATDRAENIARDALWNMHKLHTSRQGYVKKAMWLYRATHLTVGAIFFTMTIIYVGFSLFVTHDPVTGLWPAGITGILLFALKAASYMPWARNQRLWRAHGSRELTQGSDPERSNGGSVLLSIEYLYVPHDHSKTPITVSTEELVSCQHVITPEIHAGLRRLVSEGHSDEAREGLRSILSSELNRRRELLSHEQECIRLEIKNDVTKAVIEPYLRNHSTLETSTPKEA